MVCYKNNISTNINIMVSVVVCFFFFSSRRRHTRLQGDWSSDVCSSDLRADGVRRDRIRGQAAPALRGRQAPVSTLPLQIDGEAVRVEEGTTLLQACRQRGKAIPTLCYLETLHPVNV